MPVSSPCTDTQRNATSVGIHVFAHFELVSHQVSGDTTGSFDDLEAAKDVTMGVIPGLALFEDDTRSQDVRVFT